MAKTTGFVTMGGGHMMLNKPAKPKAPPCTCGNCGKPKPKKARNATPLVLSDERLRELYSLNTARADDVTLTKQQRDHAAYMADQAWHLIEDKRKREAQAAADRIRRDPAIGVDPI